MKFTCAISDLRDAVQLLQPVCSNKPAFPIVANILIRAKDNSVELTGTDLDITIKTSIEASVESEGETTVPVRYMRDTLMKIKSVAQISVEVDDNNVIKITAGERIKCNLRGVAAADFPSFPVLSECESVSIPAKEFSKMLRYTGYAMSHDEQRYILNGICFSFGEQLDVVATDGRRLAKYTVPEIKTEKVSQIIIPVKAINMMQQLLAGDDPVSMRFSSSQVEIIVGRNTLVARLMDGHYPDYKQVLPKNKTFSLTLNAGDFSNAVELASVVTDKNKQGVVKLSLAAGKMKVSAQTADIGENSSELETEYAGEPMDISFNPTFLLDVFRNIDETEVTMDVINPISPTVIRTTDNFISIIMPMRF